jgi:tetratricopeptide (TPR) repeat protein
LYMVMNPPILKHIQSFGADDSRKEGDRRKYQRKVIPESEVIARNIRQLRQKQYEQIVSRGSPSIWSFESLFPSPILDEEMVDLDLNEVHRRDSPHQKSDPKPGKPVDTQVRPSPSKVRSSLFGGSNILRLFQEPKVPISLPPRSVTSLALNSEVVSYQNDTISAVKSCTVRSSNTTVGARVDRDMTRMVEDRMYGYSSTRNGEFQYDTSLMGDGAIQFREGVRLGNPLPVNADRLNYLAKKELQHGRVDEARELYERAVSLDPRDGRGYLGLSRCAQRRRDFKLARDCLQAGIVNSVSRQKDGTADRGGNPFLLQALGDLEERMGHLGQAEAHYISAAKSRPSHAAAWVALAQLRTRKLGQSANAGRVCYQTAEQELKRECLEPSAYVYTAWANLEYHKGRNPKRARELFKSALSVDPKCSAALLQLGVLEGDCENWEDAQQCFETVLKFDQRNSRVLQAYALMETKRPDGHSRKAIDLFERALKANPRDAGVLQAYALFVAQLGDIKSARALLRRGTEVDKRHAPIWQAWGVLETRHGKPEDARSVFQQGIWACAQLAGNQSGGLNCARLWQAWGVLEAQQGNHPAARRCFSRALDSNSRNVPAITSWALMEEELGNACDARAIFERALGRFAPGSEEKMSLWRNYELMEQRLGNTTASQQVYRRAMRENFSISDEALANVPDPSKKKDECLLSDVLKKSEEVEVVQWNGGSGGEVWMNKKFIEGKVPYDLKTRKWIQ